MCGLIRLLSPLRVPPSEAAGVDIARQRPENLQIWPVSRKVNRVGNDSDATLIKTVLENVAAGRPLLGAKRALM